MLKILDNMTVLEAEQDGETDTPHARIAPDGEGMRPPPNIFLFDLDLFSGKIIRGKKINL
ncbi:MAG: hypothetical protein P4M15_07160 [Alphaproteobacteria bacterium]|nr:hypothetical protein [Alphaproteobacteria bacterium]